MRTATGRISVYDIIIWEKHMNARFFDVKKAKQDAVINAALKIFSECGYKKASTDLIVKEAGISKGLLFHYFENKKGAYEFIYDYSVKYMTLELTRAVNKSEKDFFKVQVQVERAKTRVMKNYPYMQLFLNNARFENDPEAVDAMGENRNVMQETYNGIYSQTDNTCFMDKIDINRIISMINWMSDGFIRDSLSQPGYDLDDMNEEFEKYLNMLRRHFYRSPGDDMVSIARSEMVERDDTIMDQLKLNATFEERLQAGHTGSFGAEAEVTEEVNDAGNDANAENTENAENNTEISSEDNPEADDSDVVTEPEAASEVSTESDSSEDDATKKEASDAEGAFAKSDALEDDEAAEEKPSDSENENTDSQNESEDNTSGSAPEASSDEIALPSWWTSGSSSDDTADSSVITAPVMSEIPVPADILHSTLKENEEEEEDEEDSDDNWSPRPVRRIRL